MTSADTEEKRAFAVKALQEELTADGALELLELRDSDEEPIFDIYEVESALGSIKWQSTEEYLRFLEIISGELLTTTVLSTTSAFGWDFQFTDLLNSGFFDLWKKVLLCENDEPLRYVELDERVSRAIDIDGIELISIMPLAAALGGPFWEMLLNSGHVENHEQEEFIGYAMSSLRQCDAEPPRDMSPILNIQSTRILKELLQDWQSFPSVVWTPPALEWLNSNSQVDAEIKEIVYRVLTCEDMDESEKEAWSEHRDCYWSNEEYDELIAKWRQ